MCSPRSQARGAARGAGRGAGHRGEVRFAVPYSRTHEREADRIGCDPMARAGFDPRAGVALWRGRDDHGPRHPGRRARRFGVRGRT
ncbi:MAG: hypothetical protein EOM91_17650 [Sphingobacteriia bacterium]|nr:hypothetical protein [Sphingobacteriia bacterium]